MDVKRSSIYSATNYALGNLLFTKVDIKESDVLYAAKIVSSYADGNCSYIFLFVPKHLAIADTAYAYELPWHNVQSRLLKVRYKLKQQRWDPPRDVPNIRFNLQDRQPRYTSYTPSEGDAFTLLLLHDDRKKTIYQHHSHTTLMTALTSYACVLNYEGGFSPLSFDDSYELIL
jgi:hypothetical protein